MTIWRFRQGRYLKMSRYGQKPLDSLTDNVILFSGRYGSSVPSEVTPAQFFYTDGMIEVPIIVSNAPAGKNKITNFYYDPTEDKIIIQYNNIPV